MSEISTYKLTVTLSNTTKPSFTKGTDKSWWQSKKGRHKARYITTNTLQTQSLYTASFDRVDCTNYNIVQIGRFENFSIFLAYSSHRLTAYRRQLHDN